MGKINFNFFKDTVSAEQFREYHESRHRIVHRAFAKCVAPTSARSRDDPFDLQPPERQCVEEYAILYAGYAKRSFLQFNSLFEQLQRDMQERARAQYMEQMARKEMQK
ncbi:hypothetical protein STCU_02598 [Strigomonas culicis]|uniref:Uncharacterized protein n=1 Tax=Strigomonas culicis TaxID=28005 RepID=S9UGL8_9TRYP|nr:hypothetical protein STCU_05439 [Strigomonas culicis]EPY32876.1 hypothetical protein STCU_02598 [Strigomonas culicis]|eukprot:EPY27899.1 hypothetical protein STCU_05439 [Strigomonas culicis]